MCNKGHRNTRTVKFFTDQKSLRFITPNDGGDEISINQSATISDGFHSLVDSEATDNDVEPENYCCTKAVNDTGPSGAPIKGGSHDGGVAGTMEVMVHMAAVVGSVVEMAVGTLVVVQEEVGVPSVGKVVI
ncbi:hypothetical protein RDI58_003917 [Solanum bulbocastanum]|uniref:Uncharacterized protein n=1 Tax=Solanum bulbocastanum TaxID=147425 RepID=A0AAN8U321_SOLBU